MKCCINDVNFIRLLLLSTELFKFEIQKYGQILCVHKPYFLMPVTNKLVGLAINIKCFLMLTIPYTIVDWPINGNTYLSYLICNRGENHANKYTNFIVIFIIEK